MAKVQKLKAAAKKVQKRTRTVTVFNEVKKIILWPFKILLRLFYRFWIWLKSIDIVGMVNLTLLVAIIVLFASLIFDFTAKNDCARKAPTVIQKNNQIVNVKPVINKQRIVVPQLPLKKNKTTGIKPQIKVVGVDKPVVIQELSLPASQLPEQKLYGDIIIDRFAKSPVLLNGSKIVGNLFIQNMRKYTLPCDIHIKGNLMVRNVEKLSFCGDFKISGNIYVTRNSYFGPVTKTSYLGGHIIF